MNRKRNEFLDANASDEEDGRGYDSENAAESKGRRTSHVESSRSKRRKVAHNDEDLVDKDFSELDREDEEDEAEADAEAEAEAQGTDPDDDEPRLNANAADDDNEIAPPSPIAGSSSKPPRKKSSRAPLTAKQLEATARAVRRSGVIYLSRIPPFMKPRTVQHFLSPFGAITRIFLTPEASAAHVARTRSGGNKKRSFVDGWVEFASKRDAKLCAETLNARTVGGKKGGYYHDDVWNIRYLTGFKWHHLTEQIANENAERAARVRAELSRVNRENKLFVRNVERAKMLEGMEGKKRKKEMRREEGDEIAEGGSMDAPVEDTASAEKGKKGFTRHFRQNEVRTPAANGGTNEEQSERVKRVLSKIF